MTMRPGIGLPLSLNSASRSKVSAFFRLPDDCWEARLDDAGVHVGHLELREPSLDDVFAEATGYEPVRSLAETVAAAARNEGPSA